MKLRVYIASVTNMPSKTSVRTAVVSSAFVAGEGTRLAAGTY